MRARGERDRLLDCTLRGRAVARPLGKIHVLACTFHVLDYLPRHRCDVGPYRPSRLGRVAIVAGAPKYRLHLTRRVRISSAHGVPSFYRNELDPDEEGDQHSRADRENSADRQTYRSRNPVGAAISGRAKVAEACLLRAVHSDHHCRHKDDARNATFTELGVERVVRNAQCFRHRVRAFP